MGKFQHNHSFTPGENVHIGDQGEFYCRSLYGLMKHPNGDRRPDLVSVNGSYYPKFSMEVKASKEGRGIINPPGLTYGFNSSLDYIEIFGADLQTQNAQQLFNDMASNTFRGLSPSVLYYNLLERTDGMSSEDFQLHYDDLGIKFGDQMILPHDLVFFSYVVGKMRGSGVSFDKALRSVGNIVLGFMKDEGYDYTKHRKNDTQAIHFNDFLSLFVDDSTLLRSDEAKRRTELLVEHYGDDRFAALKRREYVGPNNTRIYAFYRDEHSQIFDDQMKRRIGERRDIVTRLAQSREREYRELGRNYALQAELELEDRSQKSLKIGDRRIISRMEQSHLDRLLQWRRNDDNGHEFSEHHPDAVEEEKPAQVQERIPF